MTKQIADYCLTFFSILYNLGFNENNSSVFIDSLTISKTINEDQKELVIVLYHKVIIINQLADDTTFFFFLKDAGEIPLALKIIYTFSKASGLYLNINKCQLIFLKNSHLI